MADVSLTAGLQNLQRSIQGIQMQRAISGAQDRVSQIRAEAKNEAEQRQMLQQTANDLVLELNRFGIDPRQVESARGGVVSPFEQQEQLLQTRGDIAIRQQRAQMQQLTPQDRARFVAGVGFAPDPTEARNFRKLKTDVSSAIKGIDELDKLAEGGFAARLSPAKRRKASAIATSLKGALRIPITGGGPLSEADLEMLETLAANPLDVFQITNRQGLEALKLRLQQQLSAASEAQGFTADPRALPGQQPRPAADGRGAPAGLDLKQRVRERFLR